MDLNKVIEHIRNRDFMSGIVRSSERISKTGEWFTPTHVVQQMLDEIEVSDPDAFSDATKTFIDSTGCGDGQFLGEILIRKLENGIDFKTALSTIYGVEIQPDNVELCKKRLLCNRKDLRPIVDRNIVCSDVLNYHWRFDGSHPYDDEVKQLKKEELFASLFE